VKKLVLHSEMGERSVEQFCREIEMVNWIRDFHENDDDEYGYRCTTDCSIPV
jgi:hypothetical protein